jgi:hypothetical protein
MGADAGHVLGDIPVDAAVVLDLAGNEDDWRIGVARRGIGGVATGRAAAAGSAATAAVAAGGVIAATAGEPGEAERGRGRSMRLVWTWAGSLVTGNGGRKDAAPSYRAVTAALNRLMRCRRILEGSGADRRGCGMTGHLGRVSRRGVGSAKCASSAWIFSEGEVSGYPIIGEGFHGGGSAYPGIGEGFEREAGVNERVDQVDDRVDQVDDREA